MQHRIALILVTCAAIPLTRGADPTPSSKRIVYLSGFDPIASGSSPGIYTSFVRTYLTLRLDQTGRLLVTEQEAPPCSPVIPSAGSPASTEPGETDRARPQPIPDIRVSGSVHERRDPSGNILDVALTYDVLAITNCEPKAIAHDARSFSAEAALGEIRLAAENIANAVKQETTEKLHVFLIPPKTNGTKETSDSFVRAVRYALTDSGDEYQFLFEPNEKIADYRVSCALQIVEPKKNEGGKAELTVHILSKNGQDYPIRKSIEGNMVRPCGTSKALTSWSASGGAPMTPGVSSSSLKRV